MMDRLARWPLAAHATIVVVYVLLMGWWLTFFSSQDRLMGELLDQAGVPLTPQQQALYSDQNAQTVRMFLGEGGFVALLLLGSTLLVSRALRRERNLNRQQRNFVSAVTHELRSPIASARLSLDSILMGRTDAERTERYLRLAREDLDRLSATTEDVLATRAIAERGVVLQRETVDLGELVQRRVEALDTVHKTSVVLEGEAAPVRVDGDPRLIDQVLTNLVGNAIKYGGDQGPVSVSVRLDQGRGVVSVRDRGPGLAGANPRSLIQPFVRGGDEQVRTRPGVGLGLYIVNEIVEAHGGRLTLSDAEPGLRAEVALPLAAAEELAA